MHSSFNPDLLIHPLTFNMPFPSINGSRKHNALAILLLLSFCFSLPSSSLKCFAWKDLIMLSLASYSNSTSISSVPVDSLLLVSIALLCLIFCDNCVFSFKIWAATSSFFSQFDILPFSCKIRSCLMVVTFTETAGFTSRSPSFTSAEICFGLWSSDWLRKLGPLNHLCDLLDLIAPRPLELLPAKLYVVVVSLSNIWAITNKLNLVCNKDLEPFTWITNITKWLLWINPEILLIDFLIQLFC